MIGGDIYDKNDEWHAEWDVPENLIIPYPYITFPNIDENSVGMVSEITPNNFTIITSSLPKFLNDGKLIDSCYIVIDLNIIKHILAIL